VKSSVKILELLKLDNSLTASELSDRLDLSIITIKRGLMELQKERKIKREGSDKSGLWIVLNDTN